MDLVSCPNREGGSGSLGKERQGLNARRAALGTELCGISISGFGLRVGRKFFQPMEWRLVRTQNLCFQIEDVQVARRSGWLER